jgi:hypothetical protein
MTTTIGGRMIPRQPPGPPREFTAEGHRHGWCSTCGAEVGDLCRDRPTGRYMSGVHESRRKRTERTGGALLTRAEMKRLGYIKPKHTA